MRRILIAVSMLLIAIVAANSQTESAPAFVPKAGFVPNAETAIKIGEAVLMPVYGEKQIVSERPFHAELKEGVWVVSGTLNCGSPMCDGGTAVVKISKRSGEILDMIHYK